MKIPIKDFQVENIPETDIRKNIIKSNHPMIIKGMKTYIKENNIKINIDKNNVIINDNSDDIFIPTKTLVEYVKKNVDDHKCKDANDTSVGNELRKYKIEKDKDGNIKGFYLKIFILSTKSQFKDFWKE